MDGKRSLSATEEGFYTSMRTSTAAADEQLNLTEEGIEVAKETNDRPVVYRRKETAWQYYLRHYRLLEFGCGVLMYGVSMVFSLIDVHERDIPRIEVRLNSTHSIWARDPTIDLKMMPEQVPLWALYVFSGLTPIVVNLTVNFVMPLFKRARIIPHDTRDFLLSLLLSTGLARMLTQFMKNMTGRFRPSFYDMCGWQYDVMWDGVTNLCTDKHMEKEGRKSFPSGHSSFVWATMLLLTLYLLGRSRLNSENRSQSVLRGGRKVTKLFGCFIPVLVATWVAVTRSVDNWHHYSDIVTGSIIGAVSAILSYNYNYGSIFCWDSAGIPMQEYHNRRKVQQQAQELCIFTHIIPTLVVDVDMQRREREDDNNNGNGEVSNLHFGHQPKTKIMAAPVHGNEAVTALPVSATSLLQTRWLPYEKEIMQELYDQDALLVMAKGLGIHRLLACFIRLYCSTKNLVLCLNANDQIPMLQQLVLSLGLDRKFLPKVIDAKSNAQERMQLYKNGGCFFTTSRILVVDMLNNHIDSTMITGLLINDAHRVSETSIEAFIVRLYRERNRDGFIRGFSEETVALASGFNKMEQVLKHLYVRQVMLYPRFHVGINTCLQAHQPQVYEIEVSFSPLMKTIQEAILVALEATIKELQRSTKALDASELTMDKALTKSFASNIRRQLDPVWHKLSMKTKQLVGDLTTLRQLLSYLPRYDAISYYSFLLNHQTMSGQQRFPSPWLFTEAADRLLAAAKDRLYQVVDKKTKKPIQMRRLGTSSSAPTLDTVELKLVLEGNPKWEALMQIIDEVNEENGKQSVDRHANGGANILIMVKDERTCAQLREFFCMGEQEMMKKRFGHYLLQKEAAIKKKGGALASVGLEQQLLLKAAAKFRSNEFSFQSLSKSDKKSIQESKKRARDEISTMDIGGFADVSSFGMSMENLEAVLAYNDHKESNIKLLNRGKDTGSRAKSKAVTSNLSMELVDPMDQVVLCTYNQAMQHGYGAASLLQDLMPQCVVLYDPDMAFIRELEVFHATHPAPLEIFFMLYEESAEQQTYLGEIQKEKRAFDALIHQKAHLMMPANIYDLPFHVKMQKQQQLEYSMDTRTGGRAKIQRAGVKVVVDVREFRSALPSMLHKEAMMVLPITLEIGDYILSPQICVERKSISDLYGSMNSGRLFNQAENMRRFYQIPVLLIEFTQGKAFSLQDASEIGAEISASNIISKLTLLILHFPSLRILWSRSPHATVELFKVIKKNQEEPDMEIAAALGNGLTIGASSSAVDAGSADDTTSSSLTSRQEEGLATSYYNTSPMDVLRKLPGINDHNYRQVLQKVNNLAELSAMSMEEMTQLIGKVCAKKLYAFFNTGL